MKPEPAIESRLEAAARILAMAGKQAQVGIPSLLREMKKRLTKLADQ